VNERLEHCRLNGSATAPRDAFRRMSQSAPARRWVNDEHSRTSTPAPRNARYEAESVSLGPPAERQGETRNPTAKQKELPADGGGNCNMVVVLRTTGVRRSCRGSSRETSPPPFFCSHGLIPRVQARAGVVAGVISEVLCRTRPWQGKKAGIGPTGDVRRKVGHRNTRSPVGLGSAADSLRGGNEYRSVPGRKIQYRAVMGIDHKPSNDRLSK